MEWTIDKLAEASHGRLVHGPARQSFKELCTDTRALQEGDCFVALVGDRFDGHDFVGPAIDKGAVAVLVENSRVKAPVPSHVSVIDVSDTLYSLGEVARYYRRHYPLPVIAVTGSNGKTTTKEMIARILGQRRVVLKNEGNFNNLVGLPLTLLKLRPHHQLAVVELGINMPGEMTRLVEIAGPTVGLITNIQQAHLEGLGSPESILEEKGMLWRALEPRDLAVVNLDDDRLRELAGEIKAFKVTFSARNPNADVSLAGEPEIAGWHTRFQISFKGQNVEVMLPVIGGHHVQNALAAAAVAYGMGESPEVIAKGLSRHQPVRGRMEIHCLKDGTFIVDDSYNANPGSVMAAVRALAAARKERPMIVVLGDMRELGEKSGDLHFDVGRQIGETGVDLLITLGNQSKRIGEGAISAGQDAATVVHAADHAEAIAILRQRWMPQSWILVKGSRLMTMEKIVQPFLMEAEDGQKVN